MFEPAQFFQMIKNIGARQCIVYFTIEHNIKSLQKLLDLHYRDEPFFKMISKVWMIVVESTVLHVRSLGFPLICHSKLFIVSFHLDLQYKNCSIEDFRKKIFVGF